MKNIIVVGAGLAGLACAYELSREQYRKNYTVTVLEARNRPGGRVETLRNMFSDDMYAEAGAYWFNSKQKVTLEYVEEFGLEKTNLLPEGKDTFYHIRKSRVLSKFIQPGDDWPKSLQLDPAKEKPLPLAAILSKTLCDLNVGNPKETNWPTKDIFHEFGNLGFSDFLGRPHRTKHLDQFSDYIPSPGARELITPWFMWWHEDLKKLSALALIRDHVLANRQCDHSRTEWYTLKGKPHSEARDRGMISLPNAFSEKLGSRIRYNCPVSEINQKDSSITVTYSPRSGEMIKQSPDYLVCAIPFSTLRNIRYPESFSDEKKKAIEGLQYASVARVYLQYKKPIPHMDNGIGFTDLPIGNLLDMTFGQEGKQGRILQVFMVGRYAEAMKNKTLTERIDFARSYIEEEVFPELKGALEDGHGDAKYWDEDEWARGAYPMFSPTDFGTFTLDVLAKNEGRIYFAGDHASRYPGWIEGALESGKHAAKEIIGLG